VQMAVKLRPFG